MVSFPRRRIARLLLLLISLSLFVAGPFAAAQPVEESGGAGLQEPAPEGQAAGDFSFPSLRAQGERLLASFAVDDHDLPLDVKAEFFEWEQFRYHQTPYGQVYNRAKLPSAPGLPPRWLPGSDTSTWNGALLAALSLKYAATHDPRTLTRIARLLEGLHLFIAATGQPGLAARTMTHDASLATADMQPYTAPDGTKFLYRGDPAKGTYNQLVGGYALLMIHAQHDLPADVQRMAQDDLSALVLHVVDHKYHLTNRDGSRTTYGDLTPVIGSFGLPANAQVAYTIVAAGASFPPADVDQKARIDEQFQRLRVRHHVYYVDPLKSLIVPQKIGGTSFLKGQNDRCHLMNAGFVGLALEADQARRAGRPIDPKFVYQLGQTMYWCMDWIGADHNSLCNFQWAAVLSDPTMFEALIHRKKNTVRAKSERQLAGGIEQLRHFPLDRFYYPGRFLKTDKPQWVDRRMIDDFHWKADPTLAWQATGTASNTAYCAIDFLYAYWLLRCYRLDQHAALQADHAGVLTATPNLRSSVLEGEWYVP